MCRLPSRSFRHDFNNGADNILKTIKTAVVTILYEQLTFLVTSKVTPFYI